MTENNTSIPESEPLNIFCDAGRVLFMTYQVTHVLMKDQETGKPITSSPLWNPHMAIGAFCTRPVELGEEGSSIWAFIDEDDNLLAIDMPEPAQNGVPVEEIISVLRQMITEEDITEIMETVTFSQRDMESFFESLSGGEVKVVRMGDHDGPTPKNLISEDVSVLEEIFSTEIEDSSEDNKKKRFFFKKDK
tara:strand:+ start:900 stop:1472 length:573 start_codon:yes stop_codon:yes gene_type:complete